MPPSDGGASDVFDAIIRVLAPFIGANMARAAVYSQKDRLELTRPDISQAEVDALLERLGPGLVVFVGREKTDRILDDARRAVEPLVTPAAKGLR